VPCLRLFVVDRQSKKIKWWVVKTDLDGSKHHTDEEDDDDDDDEKTL
jgi:hypothetical protein